MVQLCHSCTIPFPLVTLVLSLLLLLLPLTDGFQVFPTSYTISCNHDCGVFPEPNDTCTQSGTQTVCYYDSPTTPKLVDCDLETEYPLTTVGSFTLTFRFEQEVSLVNFTLHYSCTLGNISIAIGFSYHNRGGQLSCSSVGQFQETFDVNIHTTEIGVELAIYLYKVFSLSEVEFFDSTLTGLVQLPSGTITAILSQSLQLFCAANECGTFEWEWYHNGTLILSGSEWVIEKHSGTQNSSLTVHDVDYSNGGNYTCSVSRQGGRQWSHAYTIKVVSGPVTLIEQTSLQQHRTISSPLPKSPTTRTMTTSTITLSSLPPTQTPISPLPIPSSEVAALPSPTLSAALPSHILAALPSPTLSSPPLTIMPSHTASGSAMQTVKSSNQLIPSPSTEPNISLQSILTLPIIAGAVVGTATMVLLATLALLGLLFRRYNRKKHLLSASENNPQLAVYAVVNKDTPPKIPLQNLNPEDLKSPPIDMHLLSPPEEQCDNPLYSTVWSPKSTTSARDDINPAYSTVCDDVRTQTTRSCPHPNPDIADTFDPTYSAVSEPATKTPVMFATETGGGKATQQYVAVANSGVGSYDPLPSTTSEKAGEVPSGLYAAVRKDIPPPLPAHYSETLQDQ